MKSVKEGRMKPSAMRRKQAVDAARLYAYGKIKEMPQGFDERQQRIFHKHVGIASAQKALNLMEAGDCHHSG